jgi:trimeric autotransporter adhesin
MRKQLSKLMAHLFAKINALVCLGALLLSGAFAIGQTVVEFTTALFVEFLNSTFLLPSKVKLTNKVGMRIILAFVILGFGGHIGTLAQTTVTLEVVNNPNSPWVVPAGVTSITVRAWGGGGGSGGHGTTTATAGGNGTASTFVNAGLGINLSAGGGFGSAGATINTATAGGNGGTASGGTTNTPGENGTTGSTASNNNSTGGNGGASPNGGLAQTGANPTGNGTISAGVNGNIPGGGAGGGARSSNSNTTKRSTGGGGGGAYSERVIPVNPGNEFIYFVGSGGGQGGFTGDGANGGAGANGRITITYTISASSPSITVSPTNLTAFTACANIASSEQTFTASGSDLTGNITITAPTGFEISTTSGSGFGSTVTLTPTAGVVANTTIYVRMAAQAAGTPSGNITAASSGATTQNVAVSGTVNANPTAPVIGTISQPTCSVATASVALSGLPASGSWTVTGTPSGSLTSTGTTGTVTGLAAATTYSFTVTNANGCISVASGNAVVNAQPVTPTAPTASLTQPTCSVPTGTITINTQTNVEYSIDGTNYQVSNVFSGVAPGSYTIYVRSTTSGNCVASTSGQVINAAPIVPTAPTATLTQPTCSVSTGTITINTQTNVEYSIDGTNYQVSNVFSGVVPGSYTIYVRSTTSGNCVASTSGQVINAAPNVPTAPTASLTQPTCSVSTGTITINTQTNVEYSIDGTNYQVSNVFSGVAPGSYTIYVRSTTSGNCVASTSGQVINEQPTSSTQPTSASVDVNGFCADAGGDIELSAAGGSGGVGATITWYSESCGGTPVGTGSPLTISKPSTSTTYFARYEGACNTTDCASVAIIVNALNTAGTASSNPTLCINTALTDITIATTGATGIGTPTGLPIGVTASFAANTITISGTPSESGTFNYSIPLTGGCGTVNATGTITVNPNNTAAAPSATPTHCINTALTDITIATTGATGIGTPTGLPIGVTASFAANTITISGTPSESGTFNYSIPLTGGCGTVDATGTITVNPNNTAAAPSATPTLCINTALTDITIATTGATGIGTPTGLPIGVTASFAANTITISGTPSESGTFTYSIPLTGGCGTVNATGTIHVNGVTGGTIGADQSICSAGNPAAFTVTIPATGTGTLSFQWQSSTDNTNFTDISGATSSTYDAPNGLTTTSFYRRITTSTLNGVECSAFSNSVTVEVNDVLAGVIADNETICSGGDPAPFSATTAASGSGTLSFQWQSSTDNLNFTNILGATNDDYDAPGGLTSTTYYRRIVTSTLNAVQCSATSNTVVVTINNISAGLVSADQTICSGGDPAPFTVATAATGSGDISYQWQLSTDNANFTDISGAIAATYDAPSGVTQTTYYRRITTSTLNTHPCSATSNTILVLVNAINPGVIADDQTLCSGGNPNEFTELTSATGSGDITYQWQSSTDNLSFTDISGANSATYDEPSGLTSTTYYRRIATSTLNSVSCNANSNTISVFINDVNAGVITNNQTVCFAGDPDAFTSFSDATGTGTLTYQWQSSSDNTSFIDISGANSATYDAPSGLTSTTYYRRIVTSTMNSISCEAVSNSLTVEVVPEIIIGSEFDEICSGSSFLIEPINGNGGNVIPNNVLYSWNAPSVAGISGAQSGNNESSIFGAPINTSGSSVLVTYNVTPSVIVNSVTCEGQPFDVVINMLIGAPQVSVGNDIDICSNSSAALEAIVSDELFGVWSTTGSGVFAPNITNATATYTPSGDDIAAGSVNLKFTAINGCGSTSDILTVNINQAPVVNAGSDLTICNGESVTLTASGANTYEWSDGSLTASTTVSPVTTTTYTVIGTNANNCQSTDQVVVTVVNAPAASITASATTICAGAPVTLTANAGSGFTYVWNDGTNTVGTTQAITVNPTVDTEYTVTVTNANNCFASSAPVLINVNALPLATISGTLEVCSGANTTLTASSGDAYLWSNGATTQAITVSPSSATSYTVTVTTNGCSATSAVATVNVNPVPVVNAGNDVTICNGESVTLTASGANTYEWSDGSLTASTTVSPVTTTTYTVIGTNANNCQSTDQVVVTVVNAPAASITASATTICAGAPVTLTANAGSGFTYLWSDGTNTVGTTQAITVNPTVDTEYTVTVTNANNCSTTSATVLINVNALPLATISGTLEVCSGASTTLTASSGDAYLWSNGATTQAITVSPSSATSYTVTVTTNGCSATSAVATVNVNPVPVVNAGNDVTICNGESVTLTASGANTYEWSDGSLTASTTVSPVTTTTYTVIGTNANNCQSTDQVVVTVVNAPAASITASATTICAGAPVTLTANAGSGFTYLWSDGTNTVGTTQAITVNPTANTNYTVTVTNANNCSTTSAPTAITVNPLPLATISGTLEVCSGASTTLTASSGDAYLWSNGATTSSITVNPLSATSYTVTVTTNGCSTTSAVATVNVNPVPVVNAGNDVTICNGASVTLTASGATSYLWNDGSTTASINVSPSTTTTYTVTGENANGCQSTDQVVVTVVNAPAASITASATTICAGAPVTLTANAGSGFTYLWSDGTNSVGTTQAITVNPTVDTEYTVTVTNANNCFASSAPVLINVNALPLATISGTLEVCSGANTTLTASSGDAYLWSNGATTQAITVSPSSATSYTVTVTTNGCSATSAVATVNVNPVPVVNAGNDVTICNGESVTLTASGANTYEWSDGSLTASTTVSPVTTTTYTVIGTNANNCQSTDQVVVTVVNAPAASITASATTICAGAPVTLTANAGSGFTYVWNDGTNTVGTTQAITVNPTVDTEYTVTVTNANNCSTTSAPVLITAEDFIDPTISAPADITVSTNINCEALISNLGSPIASDNCTLASVTNDAPVTFPIGTTIVTWTATDAAGNSASATQTVTVVDNIAPVISGMPSPIVESNEPGACGATVSWIEPVANDNCAVITFISSHASGDVFPVGITTVTYTATDAAGNSTSASFTVRVNDTELPSITAPATVTVDANSACVAFNVALGSPVTTDNCAVVSVNNNAPSVFPIGSTIVTWTVTDAAGNSATADQTVIVEDNTAPALVAPTAITVIANENCEATITELGTPIASDNCTLVSITNNAPTVFPIGTTIVTWTATDAAGNSASATQTVTVVDNIAPVISGMPSPIVESNEPGACGATVSWIEPVANDNCAVITFISSHASGDVFPVGITTVTYTATDAAGNSTSASFTVRVNDTELPSITAPATVTVDANSACVAFNVALGSPVTTDNCAVVSVNNNAPSVFPIGSTIVTWTVTDAAGNSATADQTVIVEDNTAPALVAPTAITVIANENCEATITELGTPIASDNCTLVSITNNAPTVFPIGTTIVTWTATDAAGNISTASQSVTVIDQTAPTALLTDISIVLPIGTDAEITEDMIDAGSFDNCSAVQITLSQYYFNCQDLGVNTITVTITDASGNKTVSTVLVTVLPSGIDNDFDGIDDACDDNINISTVEIPTGFTPNGDGINDKFVIPGLDAYSKRELFVYNRYGSLVYENTNYSNDWGGENNNGAELADGTYYIVLLLDNGVVFKTYVYINRI